MGSEFDGHESVEITDALQRHGASSIKKKGFLTSLADTQTGLRKKQSKV